MRAKVQRGIQRRCGSWGWELPCGAPFHGPSVMWLLWASVPRTPSHPLDTPAKFTSLTRSLLPPQGRRLLGTFEPTLGMQLEAEWRVLEEKEDRERKGAPTCLAQKIRAASRCSDSGAGVVQAEDPHVSPTP